MLDRLVAITTAVVVVAIEDSDIATRGGDQQGDSKGV